MQAGGPQVDSDASASESEVFRELFLKRSDLRTSCQHDRVHHTVDGGTILVAGQRLGWRYDAVMGPL
jgi:hypothetical protein